MKLIRTLSLSILLLLGLSTQVDFVHADFISDADNAISNEVYTRNMSLSSAQDMSIEKYYTIGNYRVADAREGNGSVVNLMIYNSSNRKVLMMPWWNRVYWLNNISYTSMGLPIAEYGNVGNTWVQPFENGTMFFYDYRTWFIPMNFTNISNDKLTASLLLDMNAISNNMELMSRTIDIPGCFQNNFMVLGRKGGKITAFTSTTNGKIYQTTPAMTSALVNLLAGNLYTEGCIAPSSTAGTLNGLGYVQLTTDGILISRNGADSSDYEYIEYYNTPATTISFFSDVKRAMKKKYPSYTPLTSVFTRGSTSGFYATAGDNSLKFVRFNLKDRTYKIYSANAMNSYTW